MVHTRNRRKLERVLLFFLRSGKDSSSGPNIFVEENSYFFEGLHAGIIPRDQGYGLARDSSERMGIHSTQELELNILETPL